MCFKQYNVIGCKIYKLYQNLVTILLFFVFSYLLFLSCKNTLMYDYDGI
jgi:hypothetical protein